MKWEYRTVDGEFYAVEISLNDYGQDGWELVSVIPWGCDGLRAYFKRPA